MFTQTKPTRSYSAVGTALVRLLLSPLVAGIFTACDFPYNSTAPAWNNPIAPPASGLEFRISGSDTRSLTQQFIDAQGTYCNPAKPGHCEFSQANDIGHILGWCDYGCVTAYTVDIGGVNSDWWARKGLPSLGEYSYTGAVTESRLADGRRKINVNLQAQNTLVYVWGVATSPEVPLIGADFTEYPLQSPEAKTPAAGDAHISAEVIVPADFVGMPDLDEVVFYPPAGMEILRFRVDVNVTGRLRAAYQGLAAGQMVDVHGSSNWLPKLGEVVTKNDRLLAVGYEVMSRVSIKPTQAK
jgi:hypothetical protein